MSATSDRHKYFGPFCRQVRRCGKLLALLPMEIIAVQIGIRLWQQRRASQRKRADDDGC
jgi:hypothetical protein